MICQLRFIFVFVLVGSSDDRDDRANRVKKQRPPSRIHGPKSGNNITDLTRSLNLTE